MAAKRPYRVLDAFLTRCRALPANVATLSYDPVTGAVAASFHKPLAAAAQLPDEPDIEPDMQEEAPIDFRFALERFNDSPKPRRQQ